MSSQCRGLMRVLAGLFHTGDMGVPSSPRHRAHEAADASPGSCLRASASFEQVSGNPLSQINGRSKPTAARALPPSAEQPEPEPEPEPEPGRRLPRHGRRGASLGRPPGKGVFPPPAATGTSSRQAFACLTRRRLSEGTGYKGAACLVFVPCDRGGNKVCVKGDNAAVYSCSPGNLKGDLLRKSMTLHAENTSCACH